MSRKKPVCRTCTGPAELLGEGSVAIDAKELEKLRPLVDQLLEKHGLERDDAQLVDVEAAIIEAFRLGAAVAPKGSRT